MKMTQLPALVLSAALLILPEAARACAVCMGGAGTESTNGGGSVTSAVNGAILFMLGVIGFMLAGVGAFAVYLHRRAKNPAYSALSKMITGFDEEIHHV